MTVLEKLPFFKMCFGSKAKEEMMAAKGQVSPAAAKNLDGMMDSAMIEKKMGTPLAPDPPASENTSHEPEEEIKPAMSKKDDSGLEMGEVEMNMASTPLNNLQQKSTSQLINDSPYFKMPNTQPETSALELAMTDLNPDEQIQNMKTDESYGFHPDANLNPTFDPNTIDLFASTEAYLKKYSNLTADYCKVPMGVEIATPFKMEGYTADEMMQNVERQVTSMQVFGEGDNMGMGSGTPSGQENGDNENSVNNSMGEGNGLPVNFTGIEGLNGCIENFQNSYRTKEIGGTTNILCNGQLPNVAGSGGIGIPSSILLQMQSAGQMNFGGSNTPNTSDNNNNNSMSQQQQPFVPMFSSDQLGQLKPAVLNPIKLDHTGLPEMSLNSLMTPRSLSQAPPINFNLSSSLSGIDLFQQNMAQINSFKDADGNVIMPSSNGPSGSITGISGMTSMPSMFNTGTMAGIHSIGQPSLIQLPSLAEGLGMKMTNQNQDTKPVEHCEVDEVENSYSEEEAGAIAEDLMAAANQESAAAIIDVGDGVRVIGNDEEFQEANQDVQGEAQGVEGADMGGTPEDAPPAEEEEEKE